jgi:hypothetical protein
MRLAGHAADIGDRRGVYKVLMGWNLGQRDHFEDLRVDGRIILQSIFKKWGGGHGLD